MPWESRCRGGKSMSRGHPTGKENEETGMPKTRPTGGRGGLESHFPGAQVSGKSVFKIQRRGAPLGSRATWYCTGRDPARRSHCKAINPLKPRVRVVEHKYVNESLTYMR